MKKLKEFLTKPRGIYFSCVALLTLAVGLMTISFSYYVPTSTMTTTEMKVEDIKNILSIDGIENNEIVLLPFEVKEITLRVKSENEISSDFHITYDNSNVNVEVLTETNNTISAGEEKTITIRLTNLVEENLTIAFDIVSGFEGKELNVDGLLII